MSRGPNTWLQPTADDLLGDSFELVSTKAMPSGIILSTYKVAGSLKTG